MNKVFRIIWSEAQQAWVVVSELTKSHGKNTSSHDERVQIDNSVTQQGPRSSLSLVSRSILLALFSLSIPVQAAWLQNGGQTGAKGSDGASIGIGGKVGPGSVAIGGGSKAEGRTSVAVGYNADAGDENSVAIGTNARIVTSDSGGSLTGGNSAKSNAVAIGNDASAAVGSVAIGGSAAAQQSQTIAIGLQARTGHNNAIAMGVQAVAAANTANAFGYQAKAEGSYATALGPQSTASGISAFAVNYGAKATGGASLAIGRLSKASGLAAVALSGGAQALGDRSIAIGDWKDVPPESPGHSTGGAKASGADSISIGTSSAASATKSIAIGREATAEGDNDSIAIGQSSNAKAYGTAVGSNAKAETDSAALGNTANASKQDAVAVGAHTTASGLAAVAIGSSVDNTGRTKTRSQASERNTIAIGGGKASQTETISIGAKSQATQTQSIAIGAESSASAAQAVTIGGNTVASGYGAISIGGDDLDTTKYSAQVNGIPVYSGTTASGKASIAIGGKSSARGEGAIVVGPVALATNEEGIAIGAKSSSTADYGIAVGGSATAGSYAVAVGKSATASQTGTSAFGESAQATAERATAVGNNAVANIQNGVALGYMSKTTRNTTSHTGWKQNTTAYTNLAGTTQTANYAAVSVGDGTTVTRQITSVAAGSSDTDAVNLAQLKALTLNLKSGGNTGHVTLSNEELEIVGANGVSVTLDSNNNKVTISGSGSGGATRTTTYKADGSMSNNQLVTGDEGYVANNNDNTVTIATTYDWTDPAGNVKYKGDNIQSIRKAGGEFHIGIKESPTFKNVTATESINVTGGPTINTTGIDMGNKQITNLADGAADGHAVTKRQLDATVGTVTYKADLTSGTADSSGKSQQSKDSYDISFLTNGAWTSTARFVGENIETSRTGNTIYIGIKETPMFKSVQYGDNGPKITNDGDNLKVTKANGNDPVKITNIADGTATNDAVNKGQLDNATVTYFHTNTGDRTQGEGEAETNKGKITEKAGARGTHSVTAGVNAKAEGTNSIAIGYAAKTTHENAVTVGASSQAGSYSVAYGYEAKAQGIGSVAVGERAVTNENVNRATALGNNSLVTVGGGVALGYGSRAETAGNIEGAKQTYSVTEGASTVDNGFKSTQNVDGNDIGAVSVGNNLIKRQITNVAAGSALTDAVNVAQLQSLTMKIGGNSNEGKVGLWSGKLNVKGADNSRITTDASGDTITISLDKTQLANDLSTSLVGRLTLKGEKIVDGSQNEGEGSSWSSKDSKTISILSGENWGNGEGRYSGDNLEVFRRGEAIHIGFKANPTFTSLKITNGPTLNSDGINMGSTGPRKITNLAEGSQDNDAVNYSQLNATNIRVTNLENTKIKYFSVNSTGGGNEDNKGATRENAIAIGKDASVTQTQSVAIGFGATASNSGAVAIGGYYDTADSLTIRTPQEGGGNHEAGQQIYGRIRFDETSKQMIFSGSDHHPIKTTASGLFSTAVGARAQAKGTASTAIGFASYSDRGGTAVGLASAASGTDSISIGSVSAAKEQGAVALGLSAKANKINSVALGRSTKSDKDGGVALGFKSEATVEGGQAGAKQDYSDYAGTQGAFTSTAKDGTANNANSIGAVSIGKADGSLTRQIVGVAAGTNDTDAANVAQLKSLTMKIGGNTNADTQPKVGLWDGMLKVLGTSGEISTSASGDTITLKLDEALKKKITDSASTEYVDNKFRNVTVTGGGQDFTVGDGNTVTTDITVNTDTDKKHFDIKGKDGVTTTVVGRAVEVGLTTETKNKINKIDDLETKVNNQGITFKGNTGQTGSIKLGDTLKVEGVTDETVVTASTDKLTLGLAQKVKNEIAGKMSSFKIKANDTGEQEITNGNTIVFKNGKNINVTRNDKELTFATTETPEFTSVQYGNNGPKITNDGSNNLKVTGADGNAPVKITNVAEGTETNDAVNKGQLDNATVTYFHTNTGEQTQGEGEENTNKGKITDKAGARGTHSITAGVNAKAVGEKAIAIGYNAKALGVRSVAVGESAMINDGAARATAIGHNSIVSVGGGVALGYGSNADTAGDIEGAKQSYSVTTAASSVENGFKSTQSVDGNPIGAVSVGNDRIKRQITNVAAGSALTDAVNVAQLQSLTMKIEGNENKHNGANANLNSADRPKVGLWSGTLKVLGTEGEIKTSASGDTITLKLDETLKNKITNLDSKVTNQGITFVADAGAQNNTKTNPVKLGSELKIAGGTNIGTTVSDNKDAININLDDHIVLTNEGNITFGGDGTRLTTLDNDGLTVKTGTTQDAKTIEVTKDGIKAGDKKIKDVAAGEVNNNSKEAVTGSQLHNFIKVNNEAVAKDGVVKFIDGTGTTVEKTNNGEIKVNVNTGTSTVGADGKAKPTSADHDSKIATVKDITDTVNKTFWKATTDKEGTGTQADGSANKTAKVKAGDEVKFKAGNNLIIKQDGTDDRDFTYSLNSDLKNINSIANGEENTGTKITLSSNSKEVNVGEAKISNVANGDVSANSKEAVTGSQLHNLVKVKGNVATKNDDSVNFVDGNATTAKTTTNGDITFDVKVDDSSIKINDQGKLYATVQAPKTTTLNVNNKGSVVVPTAEDDKAKFVNAGSLATTLNSMGFNVTTDGSGSLITNNNDVGERSVKAGDVVKFHASDNLEVGRKDNVFTYRLRSALTGITSIANGTADDATKISLTGNGNTKAVNVHGAKITDVAKPTENTDAANKKYVDDTNTIVAQGAGVTVQKTTETTGANKYTVSVNTGALATTTNDGKLSSQNAGVATVENVVTAVNAGYWTAKVNNENPQNVKFGDSVNFVNGKGTVARYVSDGKITFDANFTSTDNSVTITEGQGGAINLEVNKTSLGIPSEIKYKANGGTDVKSVAFDTGFNFSNGTHTVATVDTDGKVTFDLNSDAANKLNQVDSKMSSFKIKANSETNEATISNDNTIVFKDGKNINVTRNNKELTFATVATPEFTSVQYGNGGPKITSTGGNLKVTGSDDNAPVKITNVAAGDVSSSSSDVVNGKQLHDFIKVNDTVVNNSGSVDFANSTTAIISAENGKVKVNVNTGTSKVGDDGKAAPTDNTHDSKIATVKDITDTVNKTFWKASTGKEGSGTQAAGSESKLAKVKAGDEVKFKAGDNLIIKQDGAENRDFTYSLNKDVDLKDGSIKFNTTTSATTSVELNENGLTIKATDGAKSDVQLTASGLDNGKNKIINVAKPEADTDAANKKYVDDTNTIVEAGSGITVGPAQKQTNGANKYTVSVNTGSFGDATTGGITKTADGIAKVEDVVTAVNKGYWTAKVNNTEASKVKFGDSVNFVNGKGTVARHVSDGKITFDANLTSTDGSVTIENKDDGSVSLTVNKNSLNIPNSIKYKANGGNNGADVKSVAFDTGFNFSNGTHTVATVDTDGKVTFDLNSDAANKLNQVTSKMSSFKIKTGTDTDEETISDGNTVVFTAGKNMSVTRDGKNVTFATIDNPVFNSVQFETDGPKIAKSDGGDLKVSKGNNNAAAKITNVAEGTISGTSTDAVTGKQLHNFITANNNVVNNSGSVNFADGNHTKIDTQTTGTIKVNVTTGEFKSTTDGKLSQQTAGVATIENVSAAVNAGYWTAKVNGNTEVAKVKFGDTLDFVDGNVTTARMSEAGKVTFDVKVDDSSIKIINGKLVSTLKAPETTTLTVSEADDGTKGKVTNVAEGDKNKFVTADNIANVINKSGWVVTSTTAEAAGKGDQLVKAGDKVNLEVGDNLKLVQENRKFTYSLQEHLKGVVSIAGSKEDNKGAKITLSTGDVKTVTLNNANVTGLADGKVANDSTDAVTGKQLHNFIKVNNTAVETGGSVTFADGSGTTVSATGGTIKVNVTTGSATVGNDGKAAAATGDNDKIATVGNITSAINSTFWTATSGVEGTGVRAANNSAETAKVKAGDLVTLKAGDNLIIKQDGDGHSNFTYSLNKELNLTDGHIKFNKTGESTTSVELNENGLTITKPANSGDTKSNVQLTATGLDNGKNKVINVADGDVSATSTDAVTGKQLHNLVKVKDAAAEKNGSVNFVDGTTTNVSTTDGKISFEVNNGALSTTLTVNETSTGNKKAGTVEAPSDGNKNKFVNAENLATTLNKIGFNVERTGDNKISGSQDGTTLVKAGDTVQFEAGSNLEVGRNGTKFTYRLADALKNITSISNGTDGTGTKITLSGDSKKVDVGGANISNVGAPVSDNDAVTKKYVDDIAAGSKLKYTANSADPKKEIKLSEGLNFTNTDNITASVENNGVVKHSLNAALKGIDSIASKTADGNTEVTKIELSKDANDKKVTLNEAKVTGLKDGDVSANSKDAVTGKQLYSFIKVNDTVATSDANDSVNFVNSTTTNVTAVNGTIKVDVNKAGLSTTLTVKNDGDDKGKINTPVTDGDKFVNASSLAETLNKMGFNVESTGSNLGANNQTGKQLIKAGDTIGFAADINLKVRREGNNFTYSLNPELTNLTSAEFKTNGETASTKLTKAGLTTTNGTTTTSINPNTIKVGDKNGADGQAAADSNPITISSTAKDGKTVNTITGLTNNLPETVNMVGGSKKQDAPTAEDIAAKGKNAATVSDILNAGWNLQGNGVEKDFVRAYDTVNFVDGSGTTVTVTPDITGSSSKVKVSVDTGKLTVTNGKVEDPLPNAAELEKKLADAKKALQDELNKPMDNSGVADHSKVLELAAKVEEVEKEVNAAGLNKVATIKEVADAINNSGFKLISGADGGTNSTAETLKTSGEIIKPGDVLTMKAGKNIAVTHTAQGNITFATIDTPVFSSVQFGDNNGPKISKDDNGNIKVGNKDGGAVKVTNVAKGEADTDAVNVKQLKDTVDAAATDVVSNDGSIDVMGEVDAITGKNTYDLSVKTSAITVNAGNREAASDDKNGYVKANDVVNAINKTTKAARTEIIDGKNTKANVYQTGVDGQDIYKIDVEGDLTGITSIANGNNDAKDNGTKISLSNNPDNKTVDVHGANITNVASNLPETRSEAEGNKAITTSQAAPTAEDITRFGSHAATVKDVLNTGWNLKANDDALDFVRPYDSVKFQDGAGTFVTTATDGKESIIQIDIDNGTLTTTKEGKVVGMVTAEKSKELIDKIIDAETELRDAKDALTELGDNASEEERNRAEQAVKTAEGNVQKAYDAADEAGLNKVATAQNVAEAINNSGWRVTAGKTTGVVKGEKETLVKPSDLVTFKAGDNIVIEQDGSNFTFALSDTVKTNTITVGEKGADGKDGVDGTIGVNGKDGSAVVINGKDGSIGLNGKDGANGVTIKGDQGPAGVDGKDGETKTRIVYEYKDPSKPDTPIKEEIATLKDGQKYSGDNYVADNADTVIKKKLNERLEIKGGVTDATKLSDNNIGVIAKDGVLNVKLAKNINLGNDGSVTTGNTTMNDSGITIKKPADAGDGKSDVKLTASGLDNGGNTITNVAAGVADTDAVNVKQLKDTVNAAATDVVSSDGSIDVMGEVDATTGKNTYDLSVKTSGLTSSPDKKTVNADVAGKAFATAETVANAINTATAAATSEVISTNGSVSINEMTGDKGQNIYDLAVTRSELSISDDGKEVTSATTGDAFVTGDDVANVVNKAAASARTEVADGKNTTVVAKTGDNGQDIYNVNVEGDLADISSLANGKTKISLAEDKNELNVNGAKITNVADGVAPNDAVNVSQLTAVAKGAKTEVESSDASVEVTENRGDNGQTVYDLAVVKSKLKAAEDKRTVAAETKGNAFVTGEEVATAINTTTAAARTEVTDGRNTQVVATTGENGQDIYNVSVSGLPMEYATEDGKAIVNNGGKFYLEEEVNKPDGSVEIKLTPVVNSRGQFFTETKTENPDGTISISRKPIKAKINLVNETPMVLGNVAEGVADTDAVNVKQLKAAKTEVEAGTNVVVTPKVGDNGQDIYRVSVEGDLSNITSISNGDTKVSLGKDEAGGSVVNVNGARVTNVADGVAPNDAVNVSQLSKVTNAIGGQINQLGDAIVQVDTTAKAGIASAGAMANLPQVYIPGKSMVAAAGATFKGQSAYAIGYSRTSDNGKWVIRASTTSNTQRDLMVGAGVGYLW